MGGPTERCRDCAKLNAGGARSTPQRCPRHRPHSPLRHDLLAANECLDMVREALESLGLDMSGTPPMNYNDALRQVAQILGRKAGLQTWAGIAGIVAEHEAALKSKGRVPAPQEPNK